MQNSQPNTLQNLITAYTFMHLLALIDKLLIGVPVHR